jgi:TP901 family phage tail tape measure protein
MGSEMNVGNLVAGLTMDTSGFTKGLATADAGLSGFRKSIDAAKASLVAFLTNPVALAAVAVGALVTVGKAAFDMSEELNSAYDTIRVGTGATGDALDELKTSFDNVFKSVPADASAVGTAIADLNTRLGLTGTELESLATQFLQLSRITETDVRTNIEKVTRLFGDWDVASEDYVTTLDTLFKISQATGINIDELSSTVVQSGASLRSMGFTLEEASVMLGKFEKEGVNTETVLSSMRIALAKFAEDGINAKTAFSQTIKEIQRLDESAGTARAIEVFGQRAGPDMAAAIREGRFEFDKLMQDIEESPETIADADKATYGFAERFQTFGNKVALAMTPLGETIEVELDKAFEVLNGFADNVLPHIVSFFEFFRQMVLKIREPFEKVFGRIAQSLAKFWGNEETNTGEALTIIVDAITIAVDNMATLINWFFETIYPVIEFGLANIVEVIKMVSDIIAGDWDSLWARVNSAAATAVQVLYSILEVGWNALMDAIQGVLQGILDFIFDTINTGLKFIEDAINSVIRGANAAIRAMNKAFGTSISTVGYVNLQVNTPEIPELTRFSETELGMTLRQNIDSLSAAGGVNQTIIVNGDITNPAKTFSQTEKQAQRLAQGVYT